MKIIGEYLFNFFQNGLIITPYFAPITIAILVSLYFICDSEKERGWLLVGAMIIIFSAAILSTITDADIQMIRSYLIK